MSSSQDESISHLEEARTIYEDFGGKRGLLNVCSSLAVIYERVGDYPGSIVHWERVRMYAEELASINSIIRALEGKARLIRNQGRDSSLVIEMYLEALDFTKKNDLNENRAEILNTLGILEWERGYFEAAIGYYEEAFIWFIGNADKIHAGLMLNSIVASLIKLGRTAEARIRLEKALELHEVSGEKKLHAHALSMLGDLNRENQQLEEALLMYRKSLGMRWDIEDRVGEGWMLERISHVHLLLGDLQLARDSASKALEIAIECGERKLQEACKNLLTLESL